MLLMWRRHITQIHKCACCFSSSTD